MQWKYSYGRKHIIVIFFILFLIGNVISLLEPYVVGMIFNTIQLDSDSENFMSKLIFFISMLLVISIGHWCFHGPARIIERKNSYMIKKNFGLDMLNKILDLPSSWHRDHHSGDTIDKINRAQTALARFSETNFAYLQMIFRMFGSVVALFLVDYRAGLLATIMGSLSLLVINRFDKLLVKQYVKLYKGYNYVAAGIHDYVSNIVTIITLRLKGTVSKEISDRIDAPFSLYKKNVNINEIKWFSASFLVHSMLVITLIWISYDQYITTGLVVIGTLYMLYGYLDILGDTFYTFAWRWGMIVEHNAAIIAANPLFEAYDSLPEHGTHKLPAKWKHINIQNLNFSYGIAKKKGHHLYGVNLDLHKGKNIAFVGKSGSGKSTLMALLRGMYRTDFATVYCDKKPLAAGLSHLSETTTLIPQSPEIFNATIKENITMGLHFSQKQIDEVLKLSHFSQVVKRMKKGLQTNVMEKGVSLSGGEKQRLALARGLLAGENSDILLLDEPYIHDAVLHLLL